MLTAEPKSAIVAELAKMGTIKAVLGSEGRETKKFCGNHSCLYITFQGS